MDTMARALRDWEKLDTAADAWVAKVATHRSIDLWRRSPLATHDELLGLGGIHFPTDKTSGLPEALMSSPGGSESRLPGT